MKIYNVYQSGKRLYIDEKENPDNKIVVNKYDNMQQTIRLISDGTLPPRLYWALRNPKLSNKYFILPLINNEDLIVGTDISATHGLWDILLIGTDEDYVIEGADIDQSRLTYVSDHFGRLFVRDNFLEELDIEEQYSPNLRIWCDEVLLEVKEKANKDDIQDLTKQVDVINEAVQNACDIADEALSHAKGATKAFVYDTYGDMIAELNQLSKEKLLVNYHIMIRTLNVPDLWVSDIAEENIEYTYTSDDDLITDLVEDGVVQVGYFVLSALETQKVELSEYVKKDDIATSKAVGLVRAVATYGIGVNSGNGILSVQRANNSQIDAREDTFRPIVPAYIDYAVMKALSDSKLEWTDEQKQLACKLLNAVEKNEIAITKYDNIINHYIAEAGLFKYDGNGNGGIFKSTAGGDTQETFRIQKANHSIIDKRTPSNYHDNGVYGGNHCQPITPAVLDYAVKKALSDCKLEGDNAWTEEEKASTLELLGGVQKIEEVTDNKNAEVYTNKYNVATGKYTSSIDTYNKATMWSIPVRNSKCGIYIPDGAEVDDGVIPTGQLAVNRNYVDDLVGSGAFVATYSETSYEDILASYNKKKTLCLKVKYNPNVDLTNGAQEIMAVLSRVDYTEPNYEFTFMSDENGTVHYYIIDDSNTWRFSKCEYNRNIMNLDENIARLRNQDLQNVYLPEFRNLGGIVGGGTYELKPNSLICVRSNDDSNMYSLSIEKTDGTKLCDEAAFIMILCGMPNPDDENSFDIMFFYQKKGLISTPTIGSGVWRATNGTYIKNGGSVNTDTFGDARHGSLR